MKNADRLVSLDLFRGLTIAGMILVNNPGSWGAVYPPLLHAKWHGWTPTDLVFPFFLFIVGVAISLALSGKKERGEDIKEIYKKVISRSLKLFGLGLLLNLVPYFNFESLRIPGVLQRIAVTYLIATIIFLHSSVRTQAVWATFFLFIYWAMMEFIPVPEIGAGLYDKGANFSAWIDSIVLKGHMWSYTKTWDPEGVVSTLPAISTVLFGVLTGHLLRSKIEKMEKAVIMLAVGVVAITVGMAWHHWLPINKNIWTSSYTVFMAGMALAFLGLCYYLVDIKKWQWGSKPFIVYGMNAITVFVASGLIAKFLIFVKWENVEGKMISLKGWLMSMFYNSWLAPKDASLLFAISMVGVTWLIAWWMYKKKIFLKV